MNRRASLGSLLLAATALAAASCGSVSSTAATAASPAPLPSLATSLATPAGTWAVAVVGGAAADHNNFWQLFSRPAGTSRWRLQTPPGVASNGGLILAAGPSGSLTAAFRPSQQLASSPLATTRDNGAAWTPGLVDAALAGTPDALAADPGTGRLLVLLANGTIQLSPPSATTWTRLATRRGVADSTAGRRCGLGALTAVAFGQSGQPLVAGRCTRPGTTGIFGYAGGRWHPAGPELAAGYARQPISVLRLASTSAATTRATSATTSTTTGTTTALLATGTGPASHLLAAWSSDGGAHWSVSAPFPLNGARVTSASSGPDSSLAIVLSTARGEAITAASRSWQALPALPRGTATLASGTAGGWDALAAHRTTLAVWHAGPGARAWASTQVIKVPVLFGSSG